MFRDDDAFFATVQLTCLDKWRRYVGQSLIHVQLSNTCQSWTYSHLLNACVLHRYQLKFCKHFPTFLVKVRWKKEKEKKNNISCTISKFTYTFQISPSLPTCKFYKTKGENLYITVVDDIEAIRASSSWVAFPVQAFRITWARCTFDFCCKSIAVNQPWWSAKFTTK